jgi:hypothetical protein
MNVGLVVRLNNAEYDRNRFTDRGVSHVDLYFTDGSCPSEEIISKFFRITEAEPRAIAVHCKAGLGRTCTLIGLYTMKRYRFPAKALIGWCRLCRPGSILGPRRSSWSTCRRRCSGQASRSKGRRRRPARAGACRPPRWSPTSGPPAPLPPTRASPPAIRRHWRRPCSSSGATWARASACAARSVTTRPRQASATVPAPLHRLPPTSSSSCVAPGPLLTPLQAEVQLRRIPASQ